MTDNTIDNKNLPVATLPKSAQNVPADARKNTAGSNTEVGQQEFLMLLVNQLQNQDPMNPMNSEEFAAQLAQFSQVEQLISINEKLDNLGPQGGNSITSMASYLGNEVVVRGQDLEILGGKGPNILVDIPAGTQTARIDLIDKSGAVAGTIALDDREAGRNVISLENLNVDDGEYTARVVSVTEAGAFQELEHKVTGTVEGFVVEPTPALIVNGREVALEEILEVQIGRK